MPMGRFHDRASNSRAGASRSFPILTLLAIALVARHWNDSVADEPKPAATMEFFENKVRPIFATRCTSCHGAKKQESGLRLDRKAGFLKGGDGGAIVVAGAVDKSRLIQAVRHAGDLQMPPDRKLPDAEIHALTKWVEAGAVWPDEKVESTNAANAANHWAFQPVRKPAVPKVGDADWSKSAIDRFVLAKLESKGMKPSPMASPRDLVRRVTYDLTGLPPTAEEVEAFEKDCAASGKNGSMLPANGAYERLIDRLLASPRYGERWARWWLDVARYADTKGYVFEEERRYPYAYTFRDYVIRSFNNDLPYDRFIVEQLAADQLPADDNNEHLAALGFLTVGRRFLKDNNEIIDDRIDVVSRGFMGLTVSCARCHDHKFDPIPTADYYSLYGVFASCTEPDNLPMIGSKSKTTQFAEFERKSADLAKKVNEFLAEHRKAAVESMSKKVDAYVMAGFDLDWKGGGLNGLKEQSKAKQIEIEALRWFMKRFKTKLDAANPDQELVLWKRLANVNPAEFAVKMPAIVEKTRAEFPKSEPVQAVCKAIAVHKPKNFRDVVEIHASLLAKPNGPFATWLKAADSPIVVPENAADQLLVERKTKLQLAKLRDALTTLAATHPGAPDKAMVLLDSPQPYQPHVFLRGNPGRPGPAVPKQFPAIVAGANRKPFAKGSGRLELAKAIASPANPMTARVIVNRVWNGHFGQGIVRSPSDFGTRGDPPTHRELLDYLAADFVENGWSLKKLHRTILLSNAYRQQSVRRPDCAGVDPDNLYIWRFNRRRLDWESLRDSLLFAAGRLDLKQGGRGASLTTEPFSTRRAVYGLIDRQNLEGIFRTFDFAGPNAHSPQRFATTQPQQGLFLLNGPFVLEQSRNLAKNACKGLDAGKSSDQIRLVSTNAEQAKPTPLADSIVSRLYRAILSRSPHDEEIKFAREFLKIEADLANKPTDAAQLSKRIEDAAERLAQSLLMTNEFMFID